MFADDLKHPSYGSLDNLLADIKHDIYQGYYPRIGQIGALSWFCGQVRRGDADGHQLQSMADLAHKPVITDNPSQIVGEQIDPEIAQLFKFYDVESMFSLVKAQAHHIEKLQAKLPALKDEQPRNPRT